MGLLEDVMKTLERVPGWKRIAAAPQEIEELKRRVALLEEKLSGPKGQECRKCGDRTLMFQSSEEDPMFGDMGVMWDNYRCTACGHTEQKQREL